jgi:topoisomerase-4 subunit A
MDLKEVIQSYLDHLREVLIRRSKQRLEKIYNRLEVLDGYMKAFLNLDEVIRIIRYEDKPKVELINVFQLSDRQADAILNMRLRALNKLQEIEISNENNLLISEKETIETLLSSPDAQWSRISDQVKAIKSEYNIKTLLGARRTSFASLPEIKVDLSRAFIQKEPVTVVMSEKGWIRALKGHGHDASAIKYKDEDKEGFVLTCVTTDKLIIFASNGKFYTIGADKLPGGRGNGDPIRLLIDLENDHEPVGMFVHNPDRNLLVASSEGYGFKVKESDVVASTKGGRKTLNVKGNSEAIRCVEIVGEKIATIGENRKILIFNIDELPEMTRGKGVRLQKFKDGGLADLTTFKDIEGLSFIDSAGRTNAVTDWTILQGKRAGAGRLAPRGFSRQGLFSPDKRLF